MSDDEFEKFQAQFERLARKVNMQVALAWRSGESDRPDGLVMRCTAVINEREHGGEELLTADHDIPKLIQKMMVRTNRALIAHLLDKHGVQSVRDIPADELA
jgi:hypothetical protein